MLNSVLILETIYPCWAYALARIGQKEDCFNLDWLQNYMPDYLQNFISNKALLEGDIVVWKHGNSEKLYEPVHIQGNEIIFEKLEYAHHVAVYEGNGLVSDMVNPDNSTFLPFIIRKRKLEQLSRPDYFIRLK